MWLLTFSWGEVVPPSPFLASLGQDFQHYLIYRLFYRTFESSHY